MTSTLDRSDRARLRSDEVRLSPTRHCALVAFGILLAISALVGMGLAFDHWLSQPVGEAIQAQLPAFGSSPSFR